VLKVALVSGFIATL